MTRYEVIERIGAGRMAEIFRGKATAAGGFEKPVAIKRILPHLSSDPRFVELLIAEAKIMSVLRHRNIIQIFDVGVGDDDEHFLVMEFVDGVDVGALQRQLESHRQRLPIDLVLHIGAEVCEALDHAQHAPGPDGEPMRLVHRDVTPSNVLVSKAGEVKLTDFGLAKRPEDGTSAGGLRGRYGYVSPEQASGLPADARTDVFAVGVIMWELALGRRLFSHLADFDALRAVRADDVPRVRDHDPSLPADLDTILSEALARDPARRLPNAGELGKRLRGLRYSLDDSSGDPASALARMVARAERTPPRPVEAPTAAARGHERSKRTSSGFDVSEPTVLRIRTADGFASDDEGTSLLHARAVIDRFDEDETRMARLPAAFGEQPTSRTDRDSLALPAQSAPMHLPRDSGEVTATAPPLDVGPPRARLRPRAASQAGGRERVTTPPPVPVRPPPRPAAPPHAPSAAPTSAPPSAHPPSAAPPRGTEPVERPAPPAAPPAAPPRAPVVHQSRLPSIAPPPYVAHRAGTMQPYPTPPSGTRRWWIIGGAAAVIAALSFLITRAALEPPELRPAASALVDAGVPLDAARTVSPARVPIDARAVDARPPVDAAVDAPPSTRRSTRSSRTTPPRPPTRRSPPTPPRPPTPRSPPTPPRPGRRGRSRSLRRGRSRRRSHRRRRAAERPAPTVRDQDHRRPDRRGRQRRDQRHEPVGEGPLGDDVAEAPGRATVGERAVHAALGEHRVDRPDRSHERDREHRQRRGRDRDRPRSHHPRQPRRPPDQRRQQVDLAGDEHADQRDPHRDQRRERRRRHQAQPRRQQADAAVAQVDRRHEPHHHQRQRDAVPTMRVIRIGHGAAANSRTTASSTSAPQRSPAIGMRSLWPWNMSANLMPDAFSIFTGEKPYQRAPSWVKYLASVKPGIMYGTTVASGSRATTWRAITS
ncbi:MAG: serine/threonine protein kinase [Myxococcales bacterium]|nr:serine/threonine protein kinase [Myxococcales bacterium]